jgi:hypothetical protein
LLLPLELILLHAPNMATDIDLKAPLLHVVEIARELSDVDALLLDLSYELITFNFIY